MGQARRHLMSLSEKNTKGIQDIESAILLVSLDAEAPTTDDERAWSYWAGGLERRDGKKGFNRWFDKHEIIVDSKGGSGFNGERELRPTIWVATLLQ
jgi:carnitine O-acetyltransferase